MQQKEVWKSITGYEGLYEVSNLGHVRSVATGKIKGVSRGTGGHLKVNLSKNGQRKLLFIHRLVCTAFVKEIPTDHVVHHIDGDPTNNRLENLEIMEKSKHTAMHMMGRQHTLGHKRSREAIESHRAKVSKPVAQLTLKDELIAIYPSAREAKRQTGVDDGSISRCCNCKMYRAGKYHWKYV